MTDHMKKCTSPLRMAILCSSAGGALDGLCRIQNTGCWPFEIVGVVSDRPCDAEHVANKYGLKCVRIAGDPQATWTMRAAAVLCEWSPDIVLLLILRKIGPEIWRDLGCAVWNVHPSLLPAFPGLSALKRNYAAARAARQKGRDVPLGATLHEVNGEIDGGHIVAQCGFSLDNAPTIDHAGHLCFLAKLGLILHAVCWHSRFSEPRCANKIATALLPLAQEWATDWLQNCFCISAFTNRETVVS